MPEPEADGSGNEARHQDVRRVVHAPDEVFESQVESEFEHEKSQKQQPA